MNLIRKRKTPHRRMMRRFLHLQVLARTVRMNEYPHGACRNRNFGSKKARNFPTENDLGTKSDKRVFCPNYNDLRRNSDDLVPT
jgi:hypothetical protein